MSGWMVNWLIFDGCMFIVIAVAVVMVWIAGR